MNIDLSFEVQADLGGKAFALFEVWWGCIPQRPLVPEIRNLALRLVRHLSTITIFERDLLESCIIKPITLMLYDFTFGITLFGRAMA